MKRGLVLLVAVVGIGLLLSRLSSSAAARRSAESTALRPDAGTPKERIEGLQTIVANHSRQIERLTQRFHLVEAQLTEHRTSIGDNPAEIEKVTNRMNELRPMLAATQEQLSVLSIHIAALESTPDLSEANVNSVQLDAMKQTLQLQRCDAELMALGTSVGTGH